MKHTNIFQAADTTAGDSITLPSGEPDIREIPSGTLQYLQGNDGILAVTVTKVDSRNVSLSEDGKIENILLLSYEAIGDFSR